MEREKLQERLERTKTDNKSYGKNYKKELNLEINFGRKISDQNCKEYKSRRKILEGKLVDQEL